MKKILWFSFWVLLVFTGCEKPKTIFSEEKSFSNNIWLTGNVPIFECTISDTTHPYNIFLTLSNTETYPFQNLYMFVTIQFPRGVVRVDTIDCFLADNRGKWYGKSNDDFYKQKLIYRKNILFPYAGIYRFSIEQAMRQKELEGIHSVGIIIEELKGNNY